MRAADWIEHLAADPAIRSNTSVCLQFADRSDEEANKARQKAIAKLLEREDAAYDIAAYRDAPPGLRIWCGATVDTADIEALGPWLDWAWEQRSAHRERNRSVQFRDAGCDHADNRVLIADKMDPRAAIFRERGIDVDEKPGLSPDELKAIIGDYDGARGPQLDQDQRGRDGCRAAAPEGRSAAPGSASTRSTCPPPSRAASSS